MIQEPSVIELLWTLSALDLTSPGPDALFIRGYRAVRALPPPSQVPEVWLPIVSMSSLSMISSEGG